MAYQQIGEANKALSAYVMPSVNKTTSSIRRPTI